MKTAVFVGAASVLAYLYIRRLGMVPPLVIDYDDKFDTLENVWTDDEILALQKMVEDYGTIPSTTKDQTGSVEHIGEWEPINANGTCDNMYLIPNRNGTGCVLPARFDIASHYMRSGGRAGFKESYDALVSRILSYNKFLFGDFEKTLDDFPALASLFRAPGYIKASADVCNLGIDNPVLDPFQLGIIVQVPGQQVPMHLDAPYFWGASRFTLPIWLVVVMQFSGLWEEQRIHQVQGVAYIHDWEATDRGGDFFFWPSDLNTEPKSVPPVRNTAIVCDGAIMVHGTDPYLGPGKDGAKRMPPLSRRDTNELTFERKTKTWTARASGEKVAEYTLGELRVALVWRARCFRDEEEKKRYHAEVEDKDKALTERQVIDTLVADLRRRGRLSENAEVPEGIELAFLLMREYLRYPMALNAKIPFNYCALPTLVPWTAPLLKPFCRQSQSLDAK